MANIGDQIIAAAKKLGMTRAALAEKVDLSVDTITNIVHGRSKKPEHLQKIAQVLGLKLSTEGQLTSFEDIYGGPDLNTARYEQVVMLLDQELHRKKTQISKKLSGLIIEAAYDFSVKNTPTNQILGAFIAGMVELGLIVKELVGDGCNPAP